jgi:hypothetical protein
LKNLIIQDTLKEVLQEQDFVNNLLFADGSMPAFVINIDWSDMQAEQIGYPAFVLFVNDPRLAGLGMKYE